MEFWQIVINIAVLSVLFWWVWRGATGTFASKGDIALLDEKIEWMRETATKRSIAEMKLSGELAKEREKPAPTTPHEIYLEVINAGAKLAQDNFTLGAKTVMDALHRDGQIAGDTPAAKPEGAINIGEEDYEIHREDTTLPGIIVARNQRMAEQIGDRLTEDLMRTLDEKI